MKSRLLTLPTELHSEITGYLYPGEIVNTALTCRAAFSAFTENALWRTKFSRHFLTEYKEDQSERMPGCKLPKQHYFSLFKKNFEYRYSGADSEYIRFMVMLKEGDWDNLKKMNISVNMLMESEFSDCLPLEIITESAPQDFKDHLWRSISRGYNAPVSGRPDVRLKDSYGLTILYWAVFFNQSYDHVIRPLLAQGSSVNERCHFSGAQPIHVAAWYNMTDIIDGFLKDYPYTFHQTTCFDDTPILSAVQTGSLKSFECLLAYGISHETHFLSTLSEKPLLHFAVRSESLEMVKRIHCLYPHMIRQTNTEKNSLLYLAAENQLPDIAEFLWSHGADLDQACAMAEVQGLTEQTLDLLKKIPQKSRAKRSRSPDFFASSFIQCWKKQKTEAVTDAHDMTARGP